jgi:hypothetical protein
VPSPVAYCTVTVCPLATDSVTVKFALVVPLFPSVTVALPTESDGGPSSSLIVPTPVASAIVALDGFERLSVNVSSNSSIRSPLTVTLTCFVVCPGVKVIVLEAVR